MKIENLMLKILAILILLSIINFSYFTINFNRAFAQESNSYKLKGYEFGGGGGINIESTSYSMEGILGETAQELSSTNYKTYSGLVFAQNANVPPAPTLINDTGNRYNKLKITVNKDSGDPSDTRYSIAVSTDNFTSDIRYLQSSTSTLGVSEDFQTYSTWGGASGTFILNLNASTTYSAKVASTQGKYTQSGYSSVSSASTNGLKIAFDIDIGGALDPGETAPPYAIDFSNLLPGAVTTAANRAWIDFDTNAESGGYIYVYDQYAGLKSNTLNYTINSVSSDLGSISEGFGLQGSTKTQTSGGPLSFVSPYDGTSNSVGIVNTTVREMFNTSSSPIVGGRGSVSLKAKVANTTPGSNDYVDTLTLIATGSF